MRVMMSSGPQTVAVTTIATTKRRWVPMYDKPKMPPSQWQFVVAGCFV